MVLFIRNSSTLSSSSSCNSTFLSVELRGSVEMLQSFNRLISKVLFAETPGMGGFLNYHGSESLIYFSRVIVCTNCLDSDVLGYDIK